MLSNNVIIQYHEFISFLYISFRELIVLPEITSIYEETFPIMHVIKTIFIERLFDNQAVTHILLEFHSKIHYYDYKFAKNQNRTTYVITKQLTRFDDFLLTLNKQIA